MPDTQNLVIAVNARDGRLIHLPVSPPPAGIGFLTLEVSTHCNLKCGGCVRTVATQHNAWQNQHMSIELFRRVVDNLPRVNIVTLHGIGEPTLNPDLPAMVQHARASGKFGIIRTCTNGITRDANYFRDLHARGLGGLGVSVDSLDTAIAVKCRSGTLVDKLRENLRGYAAIGFPVFISTVVSRHNAADISNLLHELNGMGRFTVRLQPLWDYGNPEACLTAAQEASLRELYLMRQPVLPNLSLEITLSHQHELFCVDPWSSPSITVDGFLAPCCERRDPDDLGRLNLGEVSYNDAWQSPGFQAFLRRYAVAAPTFCRGCPKNLRPVEGD